MERPCVRTRILSHHALFYDSPFVLGVSLRKLFKKVTKALHLTIVPLEAGLTYRHGTSG
jgi:hypothetical protein